MVNISGKFIFIWFSLFCFITVVPTSSGFGNPSLEPHLLQPEAYSETYGFVFSMDENSHLVVQLSVSNLGLGDQNGMCRILYLHNGKSWSFDALYNNEMWSFTPPASLEMGTCRMSLKGDSLELSAELNKSTFAATLHGNINVVEPPNHLIQTSDGFFDQQILVRWGKAILTVDMEDQPPIESAGFGCMYRFWVTALPPELAYRWIKVFGLDETGADLLVVRFPPKQEKAIGWNWFAHSNLPTPAQQLEYDGKVIKIETSAGKYIITLKEQLDRHAPVENIGFWGFLVESWIGNPVTYTYLATIQSPSSERTKIAVVEIMEDEAD